MKIEKNIPIPTRDARRGKWLKLVDQMESGDSVELYNNDANCFRTAVHKKGHKVTCRRVSDDKMRVWLIEKGEEV